MFTTLNNLNTRPANTHTHQQLKMYNFTKGKRLFVTGHRENDDPDNVGGGNGHHDLVNDSRTQREHHELNSKNHMASASQESREVFRQNNNRNGLKTVHTTRSVKKTTMVNKGEQKALVSVVRYFYYYFFCCLVQAGK